MAPPNRREPCPYLWSVGTARVVTPVCKKSLATTFEALPSSRIGSSAHCWDMTSFRTKSPAERTFSQHHLLRRWRTASYQRGWRFRADWYVPEVRTVVIPLASGAVVPAPAAKLLGAARARNGVSIRETLNDFRALFTAADQALDVDALLSIAEGWAEVAETAPHHLLHRRLHGTGHPGPLPTKGPRCIRVRCGGAGFPRAGHHRAAPAPR